MNNPTLLPMPFAQNGIKNEIQVTRQPGQDLEDATLSDGFPKVTMQPIETGGLPPKGMDFNGIFYEMSDNIVFQSKGGRYKFSEAYAASVGGYPKGAILQNNAENKEYLSLVDNNSVDFNTASEQQMAGQWALYTSSEFSTELAKKANKGTTLTSYGIADAVRVYKAGAALPQSDIGPIWHADYASLMTWVVYSANGASYTGYASIDIGLVTAESQPTLRAGYIRSGATSYNQATYPILWNWAKHNGLVQNAATWKAKTGFYRDNGDGTFTPPDLTDQHQRFSGPSREVGSYQGDAMRNITGSFLSRKAREDGANITGLLPYAGSGVISEITDEAASEYAPAVLQKGGPYSKPSRFIFDASSVVPTSTQFQVVTTAFLPAIKH